jgi:hypothetical protein
MLTMDRRIPNRRISEIEIGKVVVRPRFKDLGLPDAEQRLAKAELVRVIRKLLPKRDLSTRRGVAAR